jgi:hypothetical protein
MILGDEPLISEVVLSQAGSTIVLSLPTTTTHHYQPLLQHTNL